MLTWIVKRHPRTFARSQVGDAAILREPKLAGLGEGVIRQERDVLQDSDCTRTWSFLEINLQGIVVRRAIVAILKNVAEGLERTSSIRSAGRVAWVSGAIVCYVSRIGCGVQIYILSEVGPF